MDRAISQWIEQARKSGMSNSDIQKRLENTGWSKSDINQVFSTTSEAASSPAPPAVQKMNESFPTGNGGLISVGEQIKFTWESFKKNWRPLMGVSALSYIFVFLIFIILIIFIVVVSGSLINPDGAGPNTANLWNSPAGILNYIFTGGVLFFIFVLFVPIINLLIQTWVQSSLTAAVTSINKDVTFKKAASLGWEKMWSLLWINFLIGLLSAGPIIVAVVLMIISTILMQNNSYRTISWIFSIFMVLCYVWAFMSSVYLLYSPFILFFEDKRGWQALKRSYELIKGHWWQIMLRNLLFILIISGVTILSIIIIIGPVVVLIGVLPLTILYMFVLFKNIYQLKQNS